MSSDDLKFRLLNEDHSYHEAACHEAWAKIEQLTAERDHAWEMVAKADTQVGQALADRLQDKAQIEAAVKAEQKRVKPFLDTSKRFHRRMQLLEGYWAGKLARATAERLFWKQAYCRQHSPAEGFQVEAFTRGVNAVCDALREHTAFNTYYAFLVEKVREAVVSKGEKS
jgi:hypothetical protein